MAWKIILAAALGTSLCSCRRSKNLYEVRLQEAVPEVAPPQILSNLSPDGGLKGTADDCTSVAIEHPELPRFAINGGLRAYPSSLDKAELARLEKAGIADPKAILAMISSDGNATNAANPARQRVTLKWLDAAQKYFYGGMNNQNPTDNNRNFRLEGTQKGRWYHMPWLHSPIVTDQKLPGRGRECIWGLTREVDLFGPIDPLQYPLVTGDEFIGQNWGSAFFNPIAAAVIGKVFSEGTEVTLPPPGATIDWPVGSLVYKMLFTSAIDDQQGSAIQGAWKISANINKGGQKIAFSDKDQTRSITPMAHIQMDMLYKYGPGATDWIFGTYVYSNKAAGKQYWQGMRPMGVQWGISAANSITLFPDFQPNGFYNEIATPGLPKESPHLRRMNGPADNPGASCFECHGRAQWPAAPIARLPFAPKNKDMTHQIQVLHYWQGEAVALNDCRARMAQGVLIAGKPLVCPEVIGCDDNSSVQCIPPGVPPIIPGAVGLGFSAQMQLALANIQQLRNRINTDSTKNVGGPSE
jgi:hypothetical protein